MPHIIKLGSPLTLSDKRVILAGSELQPIRPVYKGQQLIGHECYASAEYPLITVLRNRANTFVQVADDYEPTVNVLE